MPRVLLRLSAGVALLALAGAGALHHWHGRARPAYIPRDATLRALPLYFYPAVGTHVRAFVLFFGNDVGFWAAHAELSSRLAGDGYDVVGFDVKRYVSTLPGDSAARAQALATGLAAITAAARHELHADSLPVVLAGHSWGAEMALWAAAHAAPPGLVGVLAMGPGARSHLRVSIGDLAGGEPQEPGSFAMADVVRSVPECVRIAVVRGDHDPYRAADSALALAGGDRLRRYIVRWASHSLKRVSRSGATVERALNDLLPPDLAPAIKRDTMMN